VAQLDDVHSVLRLNYETPKDLISLAPPSVAKPTLPGATGMQWLFPSGEAVAESKAKGKLGVKPPSCIQGEPIKTSDSDTSSS
jgi:hypothetical protein